MSALPFTDRELTRALRELTSVATPTTNGARQNPHRLLLFYAVECGLKAVWLKRQSRTLFEDADIERTGHDLRKIIKELRVGSSLDLPQGVELESVRQNGADMPRKGSISILHQAWRYGGKCKVPDDQNCEQYLQKVLTWIQGELK